MPEETPQLPVSETASRPAFGESKQETQIQAPSLLKKISAQKKKILIGLGSLLTVLIIAGAVFGAYKLGQRQVQPGSAPTPTPTAVATPIPTQEVTITTDKTEYEQGEIIKYTVKNNRDVAIMFYSPSGSPDTALFGIEEKINDEWVKLGWAGKPCLLGEPPKAIKVEPGVEHKLIWEDQRFCNTTTVKNEKLPEGVYRIEFRYYGIEGMPEGIETYSNEFTIRGKEFSKPKCKEALDGTSCTVGLWYDELGRACGGQSCVGLGLGKCYKEECIYFEEYENLSKNPQTECLGSCRCMEKCNEKGPTYFIPVDEGSQECLVNSINKICCCSGV